MARIVRHLVAVSHDLGGINLQTLSFRCTYPPNADHEKADALMKQQISEICWQRLISSPERCLSDVRDVGELASQRIMNLNVDAAYASLMETQQQRRANSCIVCGRQLAGRPADTKMCLSCECDMGRVPPGTEYLRAP